MMGKKIILGASIGNCVHVAGLYHFLKLAEVEGYETIFLGPAVSLLRLIDEIKKHKPTIVAVSYRLTPENANYLFAQLNELIINSKLKDVRFIFGGTRPVAEIAKTYSFFERIFTGEESQEKIKAFLRGKESGNTNNIFPDTLIDRISQKYPYPLLRHHFGRPNVEETILGVEKISEAEVLDIISLGTDQNAQEHFFHPEDMILSLDGAGGVAVRKKEDLIKIYNASRRGNYPLMRCYSGTRDLRKWAEMSVETMNNAWAAIPLTWYNVIDGRSNRLLKDAIKENQDMIKWYAQKNIPVEINESHQWSLRDAHDSLAVTMAYIAAYNAKKLGVKNYIAQYMFNTPPGTSPKMDLAKMLAKKELISTLHDDNFKSFTEVRAGIAHFSSNQLIAKGQLASSAVISLALKPHILHVVGFSEGHHAIFPEELIESCQIIHGVLINCLHGLPNYIFDSEIINRKEKLIGEAKDLIAGIKTFADKNVEDALADPLTLSKAIKTGLLDTPHFVGNPHLCGKIITQLISGGWYAVDPDSYSILNEKQRINSIINKGENT
jgi:hypothetical protein